MANQSQSQISDLMKVNPLIEFDGDTSHVEAVLGLVSFLILDAGVGCPSTNDDQAHGLAFMLDTCKCALKSMRQN